MKKTQARDTGNIQRGQPIPHGPLESTPLALHFLTAAAFESAVRQHGAHILGAAVFGKTQGSLQDYGLPLVDVTVPVIGGETVFEVWSSQQAVRHVVHSGIRAQYTDEVLFGCLEIEAAQTMQAMSYAAYTRLFDFLDESGFPHLWRIWHYLPDINGWDVGQERYHGFNIGRHEAFLAKGRRIGSDQVPAACALGSQGKNLALYFLAARRPGKAIENPRQTSAYRYPPQYGPRSPTFARAMLTELSGRKQFFISGTASIVGHASQHIGDIEAQTQETLVNVQTLLSQARHAGLDCQASAVPLKLKVYLHRADYLATVQKNIESTFGQVEAVYLQADVCRNDLLLEIEGVCFEAGSQI